MSEFLGGVSNLFCKIRGGQYFAAEGRKIEGTPTPLEMFLAASLSYLLTRVYIYLQHVALT